MRETAPARGGRPLSSRIFSHWRHPIIFPLSARMMKRQLFCGRHRLAVETESLDFCSTVQFLQFGFDSIARHQLTDLLPGFLETRRLAGAVVFDLYDMPPELGLDRRFGVLARWQRKGGIGEFLDHVVMAEIAEIATRLAAGRSEEHTSELQSRRDLVCRL